MMPFGLEVTLFATPLPNRGEQRDPEPTAEGATEGSCCFPRTRSRTRAQQQQQPLPSSPPRAEPLSRANPEQRGAPGCVLPS